MASKKKLKKWKKRARAAESHLAIIADLNNTLTEAYRDNRTADAAAVRFASEAIAALAADAAALHATVPPGVHTDYVDYLTFRLRQNLLQSRKFLDEHGQVDRAATIADLLNELPPSIAG